MKQQITKDQWEELNEECKKVLQKFFYSEADVIELEEFKEGGFIPLLLSIGQMIEFLNEDDWSYIDDSNYDSVISFGEYGGNLSFDIGWKGELCDALWNAVKYKLKS